MIDALAIALDPNMTPDAVRVCLYYASLGPGEHPYDADRLSALLEEAGEKRIRKALQRAERCGHLTRHHGGQRSDRFSVCPAQAAGESVSPPSGAGQSVLSPAEAAGETCPTTTTGLTPPPPISPLRSDGLELVREYLGAEVVDMAVGGGVITAVKLKGILGLYGPSGTQTERAMPGLSPPDRRKALQTAVMRMAMDAKQYNNRLFEKYLERAIKGDGDGPARQQRSTGTDGALPRGAPGAARGEAPGGDRGQRFQVE